jgi:hypothetical protein
MEDIMDDLRRTPTARTPIEREVDRLGSLVRDVSIQVDAIRKRVSDLETFGTSPLQEVRAGKGKDGTPGKAGKGTGGKAGKGKAGKGKGKGRYGYAK